MRPHCTRPGSPDVETERREGAPAAATLSPLADSPRDVHKDLRRRGTAPTHRSPPCLPCPLPPV
jgi:hypothetical protein